MEWRGNSSLLLDQGTGLGRGCCLPACSVIGIKQPNLDRVRPNAFGESELIDSTACQLGKLGNLLRIYPLRP